MMLSFSPKKIGDTRALLLAYFVLVLVGTFLPWLVDSGMFDHTTRHNFVSFIREETTLDTKGYVCLGLGVLISIGSLLLWRWMMTKMSESLDDEELKKYVRYAFDFGIGMIIIGIFYSLGYIDYVSSRYKWDFSEWKFVILGVLIPILYLVVNVMISVRCIKEGDENVKKFGQLYLYVGFIGAGVLELVIGSFVEDWGGSTKYIFLYFFFAAIVATLSTYPFKFLLEAMGNEVNKPVGDGSFQIIKEDSPERNVSSSVPEQKPSIRRLVSLDAQREVGFMEAVRYAFNVDYCNFSGRASRSQFWWFQLFVFIVNVPVSIWKYSSPEVGGIVGIIVSLILLLPSLGLAVRRLHDVGKSGWWILISLVPVLGWILLIIWWCKPSEPFENRWGFVPEIDPEAEIVVLEESLNGNGMPAAGAQMHDKGQRMNLAGIVVGTARNLLNDPKKKKIIVWAIIGVLLVGVAVYFTVAGKGKSKTHDDDYDYGYYDDRSEDDYKEKGSGFRIRYSDDDE